jgi:DNA invertase Pin-like site-specific DNA recombinase
MKDQIVKPIRAVEYIRMSTDLQRYSVLNQQQRIAEYALLHGITVIRTYKDEGKSGLKINRREALQSLLDVVSTGRADFELILVFDISRWGRFQDSDESAYYEFICRAAGVKVIYCAERFENDGTPISNIMKGLKRVMAAEYSRSYQKKYLEVSIH